MILSLLMVRLLKRKCVSLGVFGTVFYPNNGNGHKDNEGIRD